ncbi:MAG: hypothetical protein HZA51_13170 [Planctomycetes bacterium]|nr:hypothetical protein [Planctomycetota bacterium]
MTCSKVDWLAGGLAQRVRPAFVVSIIAITHMNAATKAADDQVVEITPDNACQASLANLFSTTDKPAFNRQVDQIIAGQGDDGRQVVPQLVWYAARHQQETRTKAFVGQVLARIAAPKSVIVEALVPHLDNKDAAIRGIVKELLVGYEDRSATRPPDYSAYRALIEADVQSGREPQSSLVQFMYASDPGTALQTMVRACQLRAPDEIKPILWSEHVVSELFWKRRYGFVERSAVDAAVVREIETLSRHPRWWVRLYAAEIVKSHPELSGADVVKRLKEDTDIRVREVLGR